MSVRRLRTRKTKGPVALGNSTISEDEKENINSSSNCDTATLSSDFSQDDSSHKRKYRRKKIRRTQDFQNLMDSFREEVDKISKHISKTKKSKNVKYLPKIQGITEVIEIQRKDILGEKESMHLKTNKVSSDTDLTPFHSIQNLNEKSSLDRSPECEALNNKKKRTKQRTRHTKHSNENLISDLPQLNDNEDLEQNVTKEVPAKGRRKTRSKKVQLVDSNSPVRGIKCKNSLDSVYTLESDLHETQKFNDKPIKNDKESISPNAISKVAANDSDSDSDSIEYNFKPRFDTGSISNVVRKAKIPPKSEKLKKSHPRNSVPHKFINRTSKTSTKIEATSNLRDPNGIIPEQCIEKSSKNIMTNSVDIMASENIVTDSKVSKESSDLENNKLIVNSVDQELAPEKIKLRRRTYDLDDSINDINILKSLSVENTPDSEVSCENIAGNSRVSPQQSKHKRTYLDNSQSQVTKRRKDEDNEIKFDEHSVDKCEKTVENVDKSKLLNHAITYSPLAEGKDPIRIVGTTPSSLKNRDTCLLKKAMENAISAKKMENFITSNKSSTKKPLLARTKMPDFSSIHKKAFERMENLEQMMQRRAERAKLLLSGSKPMIGSIKKSPQKDSPRDSKVKKQLQFGISTNKQSSSDCATRNSNHTGIKRSNKVLEFTHDNNSVVSAAKSTFSFNKLFESSPKLHGKSKIPTPKGNNQMPKERTVFQLSDKNMSELPADKNLLNSKLPLGNIKPSALVTKNGYTRFGFKATVAPADSTETKKAQLKAVADKTNIIRSRVEERRNIIKGVRSNRRFELLMNMRKKS